MWKAVLFLGFFLLTEGQSDGCVPKSYGNGKIVCVCNATYCDETPEQDPKVPVNGSFYWYVSSKDGQRLNFSEKQFGQCPTSLIPPLTLNVDKSQQYQKILGFGGAFTDSVGINIKKLSEPVQKKLLCTYFCKEGSRYSLGRLPIAGTDFSLKPYTYDDHDDDLTLANFSLASEDYNYKIPFIQKALKLNPELLMVSAAWSAPAWMKTNDKVNGHGFLKKDFYQLYADYILKFVEEYGKNNISVWGVSTGNEPLNAYIPFDRLNTMGWTSETVSKWVGENLGPTLAASSYNNTKILLLDDQRIFLPWFIREVLSHEKANQYASGVAVHFYFDFLNSPDVLTQTHDAFPDKFILMTEACLGPGPFVKHVDMGAWNRGETYMSSILDYLNNWSVGWIDWNLALDETGGPNWINNNVDSPIIVNATTDEFYKQPMFYAVKHFSRFIPRGSTRISMTDGFPVKSAAFVTPSNETVVVLLNQWDIPRTVVVNDLEKGKMCVQVPAHSMHTIIYGN
ncbi:lysosomal acid glucosylceramidase-like [Lasioglossum baleicum]|uniref:lysosomal acid glucosylceramidase-like n=1 Tax=Lasioglossum baleicum TaxID=434251 RepID=UPI003FCDE885